MASKTNYFEDLNSEFEGGESDIEKISQKPKSDEISTAKIAPPHKRKADKRFFEAESSNEERKRSRVLALDAYTRHKMIINDYLLFYPGATKRLQRDTSRDVTDLDVIRKNHKFLWPEGHEPNTWETKLAKRYYDKLFKEYCICDLSRYKENKVAMRWRVEKEVVEGKGQFICGERKCKEKLSLCSWEVNFAYVEDGLKHNSLVKLRLCADCSYKLNYHTKKNKATKKSKHSKKSKVNNSEDATEKTKADDKEIKAESSAADKESAATPVIDEAKAAELWSKPVEVEEEKSREQEFEDFLEDLLV